MNSRLLRVVDGQAELPLARQRDPFEVPHELVIRQTHLAGAIALCVQVSGLEDKEVYGVLGIDAGHWTRIMKGDAHFPVDKLNDLMELCGNEAPLLWLAHSRGYYLKLLQTEAERRAEQAEAALEAERQKVAMLQNLLTGKAA